MNLAQHKLVPRLIVKWAWVARLSATRDPLLNVKNVLNGCQYRISGNLQVQYEVSNELHLKEKQNKRKMMNWAKNFN